MAKRRGGPKPNREKLNAFAEALAESGSISAAARSVGVCPQRGSQLMAKIRGEINEAQRAAGFGDWA